MSIRYEPTSPSPLNKVIAYVIVVFVVLAMFGFAVLVLLIARVPDADAAAMVRAATSAAAVT